MTSPLILVADDHPLFRDAVAVGMAAHLPDCRFETAATLAEALTLLQERTPALLLLDLDMPGAEGLSGLVDVRAAAPAVSVAILSATIVPAVVANAIALGARGYLHKSLDITEMIRAIHGLLAGALWLPPQLDGVPLASRSTATKLAMLSPQQLRILRMVTSGLLNKQIAAELGIGEQTVKDHITMILRKMGVTTRTQAAVEAERAFFAR